MKVGRQGIEPGKQTPRQLPVILFGVTSRQFEFDATDICILSEHVLDCQSQPGRTNAKQGRGRSIDPMAKHIAIEQLVLDDPAVDQCCEQRERTQTDRNRYQQGGGDLQQAGEILHRANLGWNRGELAPGA
jgi:hypothetical protein